MFIPPLHWYPLLHRTSWSEVTQTTNLNTRNLRCYMYNIFTEFLCIFLRRNLTPIVIVPNPSLMFEKYCIYIICWCFHIIYSFSIASRKKRCLIFFQKCLKWFLTIFDYERMWPFIWLKLNGFVQFWLKWVQLLWWRGRKC